MKAGLDAIARWPLEKTEICQRITARDAGLKVVLKTKDDPFLLERWIGHHLGIVGDGNVIIFDNGSTDPKVLETYERFRDRVILARYDGFVDNLHRVAIFPELYASLRASADRYAFLDTDEFLVWLEPDLTMLRDERVLDRIGTQAAPVLPGIWLHNLMGTDQRFWVFQDGRSLVEGLKWGKPLVSRGVDVEGFINHNSQLPWSWFADQLVGNCFVLHLNRLSPRQRIASNLNKLMALGALARGTTAAEAAALDPEDFPAGNLRTYMREIKQLAEAPESSPDPAAPLAEQSIRVLPDGRIEFQSSAQEALLRRFVADPRSFGVAGFGA